MTSTPGQGEPDASIERWPTGAFSWGWVAILLLAYACSYIDRQILSLMIDPIKADLDISDSQFSLLHGLSFAMLYCTLGFPIGALVDRHARGRLVAYGVMIWSTMTALCGTANSFVHLFIARIGVGVGEATLTPAAYSLLADCFPPYRLGRALSVYIAGAGLGAGLAFIVGGSVVEAIADLGPFSLPILGELRSWQVAFMLVGLPGLPIALILFFMREPARRGLRSGEPPTWRAFFSFLGERKPVVAWFMLAAACSAAIALATLSWLPAFLMRTHSLGAAQAGLALGAITIVGITGGLLTGAWMTEMLANRGVRHATLRVCAVGTALAIPAMIAVAMAPGIGSALAATTVLLFVTNTTFGIGGAVIQTITPNDMRGRMSAFLLFCQNAFGMVVGPLLPALITDTLFGGNGTMVGYSLAIAVTLFGLVGATAFWRSIDNFDRLASASK